MSLALFNCIFFFMGWVCSLPVLVIRAQNISLGSTLTAGGGGASNSSWLSPSGDFAFGFQQVSPSGPFLLAIWFNNIPDQTITWSANGDQFTPQGATLHLSANGLLLTHPNGNDLWNTSGGGGVSYAAMLNTGNLVLANENHDTVWQSFDEPTDTLLPTQVMKTETALLARFSNTNYSHGRFKLQMQNDGNLVLYTLNWPRNYLTYSEFTAYYSTRTKGSGYHAVFNQSGSVYVGDKNENTIGQFFSGSTMNPADRYQRAILEFDGVFRRYVWSTSANQSMSWVVRDYVPRDICFEMTQMKTKYEVGGGACGFNSYCEMGEDQRPKCGCPPGYIVSDETDHLRGCKRNFTAQSCLEEAGQSDQFQLTEMSLAVDFVGADYDLFLGASEADCRDSCLSDCFCAAAVLDGGDCWKKRFPLFNGRAGTNVTARAFIKVGIDNSTQVIPVPNGPNRTPQVGDKEAKAKLIVLISFGSSAFLNVLLLTLAVIAATFYRRKSKEKPREHRDIAGTNMRSFSYKELQEATSEFKEVIGQGAFVTVYKGVLDSEEGKVVAVKKLNESVKENEREFESEVKAIAITGHRNLVQLVGFCNEEQHRLLVYEYMPNGCIADILFGCQRPNWVRRIKFASDIARGLNYLHDECSIPIIHCDIKPQNVLLDESFTARISDFGLAKLLKKDQTHTLTGIRGTKGYVAPEWFKSMPITAKVDVYSYGIMLLEIICCRRCFVAEMEDEMQMVLADWANDCYKEGRVDKLVEGVDEALTDIEKVKELVMVALWCTQEDPTHRPSMNKVVEIIKGGLEDSPPHGLIWPQISSPK